VLFPSPAFRLWLATVSSLLPQKYRVEARRFRPGLDYTLARSEQSTSRLDVVLGLTPPAPRNEKEDVWEDGRCGGWECYMAPHEGEGDPAVYKSGRSKRESEPAKAGDEMGSDSEGEADEDGTLLVAQPGFNRLLIVLRDPGVLNFVKYVSAEAEGCRWDVCGEWEVEDMARSEENDSTDSE